MIRRTFLCASAFLAGGLPATAATAVPQPLAVNLVATSRRQWNGLDCLAIELTDEEQKLRRETTGGGNRPSMS